MRPPRYGDVQGMKTEIRNRCADLQAKYIADPSPESQREILVAFEDIHRISGLIVQQIRNGLYGGPKAG